MGAPVNQEAVRTTTFENLRRNENLRKIKRFFNYFRMPINSFYNLLSGEYEFTKNKHGSVRLLFDKKCVIHCHTFLITPRVRWCNTIRYCNPSKSSVYLTSPVSIRWTCFFTVLTNDAWKVQYTWAKPMGIDSRNRIISLFDSGVTHSPTNGDLSRVPTSFLGR